MSASNNERAMLGREGARRLLEGVLRRSQADQTEAVLTVERLALTRFADSYIHQNVSTETPVLTVRAVVGARAGIASTTRLDDASIARVVEDAAAIARYAPENREFHGLPTPGPGGEPGEAVYSAETMTATPETRATAAGIACRLAREAGLGASGSVTTTGQEIAVVNSRGVFAYTPRSAARVVVVAVGAAGSGYAEDNALDISNIDAEAVARRAVDIGRRAQDLVAVAPGDYTVILQPEAVADIMAFLARLRCRARRRRPLVRRR